MDENGNDNHFSRTDKKIYRESKNIISGEKEDETFADLIQLIKTKIIINDEGLSDYISRSPMRNQNCHQSATKPYDYPCNVSRFCGGVTRVVEAERPSSALYKRLYPSPLNVPPEGHVGDVNLCDISTWLNLCQRDPKLLSEFLEDCHNELSKRDVSTFFSCRTNRNVCSNVSSQFVSPVQSPSEQSVTSPESATCEDNSLYQSKSPYLDGVHLNAVTKSKETGEVSPGIERFESYFPNYLTTTNHLNIPPDGEMIENFGENRSQVEPLPNIGTVMLNLTEDPYESTIDLNQFSSVCDGHAKVEPPSTVAASVTTATGTETETARTKERDELNQRLDAKTKETAWARISQLDIDQLGKGDKEGDTQLMILLVSEKLRLEYVYVIVERLLKQNPEYLSCRNDLNQDALYLAALKLVHEPLVASYLAEAFIRGKQDVNVKYEGGNTLFHCLARKGDSHVKILERLASMKHPNRTSLFDINKKNNRGFTPLHVACEGHVPEVTLAYETVKVLLENGADCTARDYKDENTPLHTLINESCDIELTRILLETERKTRAAGVPPAAILPNRQGNTALHLACGRNSLTVHHQKDVIRLLLRHGAMIQLKNMNGCVPSVLINGSRKQEIKAIFHGHRQKSFT